MIFYLVNYYDCENTRYPFLTENTLSSIETRFKSIHLYEFLDKWRFFQQDDEKHDYFYSSTRTNNYFEQILSTCLKCIYINVLPAILVKIESIANRSTLTYVMTNMAIT